MFLSPGAYSESPLAGSPLFSVLGFFFLFSISFSVTAFLRSQEKNAGLFNSQKFWAFGTYQLSRARSKVMVEIRRIFFLKIKI